MALNQVGLERLNTATTKKIGTNKNIIINGAMQVAQRGTSSTSTGYQTVDRFRIATNSVDEAPTQAQVDVTSGTEPFTKGLRKAFRITNGNQTSGAGVVDTIHAIYTIEDQDLANSGWNHKSSSSYITLSFYVKSSVAQNFFFFLQSDNGSQFRYVMETGSLSADTWTKITKTIPGNTNIVLNNDNGIGMYIVWPQFDGTDRTGTRPLNAWAALDNTSRTPDQTSTWYTTDNATWEITGVQLEVGSVATDFEHRSFGKELALCERYFEKSYNLSTVAGTATDTGLVMWLANRNPGLPHTTLRYRTIKRANPTVTIFNTNTADSNTLRDKDSATDLTPQVTRLGESGCTIHTNTSVALGNFIAFHYTAESEL